MSAITPQIAQSTILAAWLMALDIGSAKPTTLRPSETAAPGTFLRMQSNSSCAVIRV